MVNDSIIETLFHQHAVEATFRMAIGHEYTYMIGVADSHHTIAVSKRGGQQTPNNFAWDYMAPRTPCTSVLAWYQIVPLPGVDIG